MKQVTILGAGMMGKQIATFLVNHNIGVDLVKVTPTQQWSKEEATIRQYIAKRLLKPAFIERLTIKPLDDVLSTGITSDLVIESIVEDLSAKQKLFAHILPVTSAGTLLASNTSSLSIAHLAADFSDSDKQRFSGLHFFAPVRQMRLVEVIPHDDLLPEYQDKLVQFVSKQLGKEAIVVKDVLGFLANRIGFFANHDLMRLGEEAQISPLIIDYLSSRVLKRSPMGPYALSDYTGLELSYQVRLLYAADEREKPFFRPRPLAEALHLLNQESPETVTYYKKEATQSVIIDPETLTYKKITPIESQLLDRFSSAISLSEQLQIADSWSSFLWKVIENLLYYAVLTVGYATKDYRHLDRCLVLGYNWQLGPFQLWDSLGFDDVKARLKKRFGYLPDWIEQRQTNFYQMAEALEQDFQLENLASHVIWERHHQTSLRQTPDKVLVFSLTTPKSSLTPAVLADLQEALTLLEDEAYKGLVIHSIRKHFSVGYDLHFMKEQIQNQTLIATMTAEYDRTHALLKALKHSSKPVIAAIHGKALGGGAELAMQASEVVAEVNSQIGLVEYGLGLIPGGGGLAHLTETTLQSPNQRAQKKSDLLDRFLLVSGQKVSHNAFEAIRLGLLKSNTTVVRHKKQLLSLAIDRVRYLDKAGYFASQEAPFTVFGLEFIAIIQGMIRNYLAGGFIQQEEVPVLEAISFVMAGGEVPMGVSMTYTDILTLEKDCFLQLLKRPETILKISQKLGLERSR